jgi:uncharacterized membrane protein SirB2
MLSVFIPIHLLAIAVSVLVLIARYVGLMGNYPWQHKRFWIPITHVANTLLIATGIAMIWIIGVWPFTAAGGWLTEKLTCVLAYFALGYFTLHIGHNKVLKTCTLLGALGWLIMAANMAVTHAPLWG